MRGAGEGGQEGLGAGNSVTLCTPRPPALHTPAGPLPTLPSIPAASAVNSQEASVPLELSGIQTQSQVPIQLHYLPAL